jgi:dipicolinate synthase subunit A
VNGLSEKGNITVIGADLRQIYMIKSFYEKGYTVYTYGINNDLITDKIRKTSSLHEAISKSNILICPIPFSKDNKDIAFLNLYEDKNVKHFMEELNSNHILFAGLIPDYLSSYCNRNKITHYDFMKMNDVAILNAIATAEGTIAEAIKRSSINLHGSKSLVLGFGRCAQILASKLKAFDVDIYVCARSKDDCAFATAYGYNSILLDNLENELNKFDFVFNTIPALILTKDKLEKLSPYVTIIDIASAPGGLDYKASESLNLNASLCSGLPGIYSPKSSGEILADVVENILIERSGEFETK